MALCYKDREFCKHWKECNDGDICNKALTPKVQKEADKWWEGFQSNDPTPICVGEYKPKCFVSKN